jgi:hypothetical protein
MPILVVWGAVIWYVLVVWGASTGLYRLGGGVKLLETGINARVAVMSFSSITHQPPGSLLSIRTSHAHFIPTSKGFRAVIFSRPVSVVSEIAFFDVEVAQHLLEIESKQGRPFISRFPRFSLWTQELQLIHSF